MFGNILDLVVSIHTVIRCRLHRIFCGLEYSRRSLPLCPYTYNYLCYLRNQQLAQMQLCGGCYNQDYLDFVCVDNMGMLLQPDFVSQKFQSLLEKYGLRKIRFHDLRHPYVKHTTKKYFLQKQKSQTIKHTAMVWDSGFFNHLKEQILNRTGLGLCT